MDLEAAFDAHHAGLFRYLVRLTGDPDLSADAAQEAFVRLAEKPPADQSNLRSWLYRVATNFAFDIMKVTRRRGEILSTAPESVPHGTPAAAPDTTVEQSERQTAVRGALDQLREKDRTVLVMRAEGFSYKEIAATVGIPVNSVGAVAARALRKLATVLGPLAGELT